MFLIKKKRVLADLDIHSTLIQISLISLEIFPRKELGTLWQELSVVGNYFENSRYSNYHLHSVDL